MKLSEHTLAVLKNFSAINSGIVLQPGKIQRTVSPEEQILAEVELEDAITDREFGIYDLNQFLGNVTTLDSPELTFEDKFVLMKDTNWSMKYFAAAPALIIQPQHSLELSDPDVVFNVSQKLLEKVLKLAAMNDLPNLSIVGKGGKLAMQAHDAKNDTSNCLSTDLGSFDGADFICTFRTENIQMMPDDYKVSIKNDLFGHFEGVNKKVRYFIAPEA